MRSDALILLLITGMPGAGKSIVAEFFKEEGFPVICMGDVIREEVKKRGLEYTPETGKKIMLELREKYGNNAVAIKCIEKIKQLKEEKIVVEGVRSLDEVEEFKKIAKIKIIGIHASPSIRFERLSTRKRGDDPNSYEIFKERDLRELKIGLGNVIALSDIMIINESTLEDLHQECVKIKENI